MSEVEQRDSLGDRMKRYERSYDIKLPWRMPVIVRIDGRAFHTLTKQMARPFDARLMAAMDGVAMALCEEMAGAVLAFIQSDEVSVLLHTLKRLQTQPWMDNKLQKLASLSASIATAAFNEDMRDHCRSATFDGRAFVLPEAEVTNYFLWRQQDATRNSIQMLARSLASHKECENKNTNELQELSWQRGTNWNDLPTSQKRGRAVTRATYETDGETRSGWALDYEVPIFKGEDRGYIEKLLETKDEVKLGRDSDGWRTRQGCAGHEPIPLQLRRHGPSRTGREPGLVLPLRKGLPRADD